MPRNLESLPNETLSLILNHFCLHCSKARGYDSPEGYFRHPNPQDGHPEQDPDEPAWYSLGYRQPLYSLCLVSKHFRALAQPVLYHEFIPGYGDAWRSTKFSWEGRLASFVLTLAARPDLAALVRRVYVHCFLLRPVADEEAQATVHAVLGSTAHEYVSHFERMRSSAPVYIQTALRTSALELLGMLLALVPNLDRLGLQMEGPNGSIPAGALSTLASLLQSRPLAKLQVLDICDRSLSFSLNYQANEMLQMVVCAGGLLSTLNLHMCHGTALHLGQGKLRNITTMRITHARLNADDLASLLDSCAAPGLKSFTFEATPPLIYPMSCTFPVEAFGGDNLTSSDAIRQLKRHKETLELLHLDLRARAAFIEYENAPPLSETLKDFTLLRHVSISANMLYNNHGRASYASHDSVLLTSLLPTTIKTLCLTGSLGPRNASWIAHALLYLARYAGGRRRFPDLHRVRCGTTLADEGLADYALELAFAKHGVEFGYDEFPLSEPTLPGAGKILWDPVSDDERAPLPDDDDDL